MNTEKYLQMIQQDIHSVVFATTDENHYPVTCVIDIMLSDRDGLYFLTAKGKNLYERLKNRPIISFTGMKGADTLSCKSITLRGEVREIGQKRLSEIFEKNPYMKAIYPTGESRMALTVFHIYRGSGEYFDLSRKPVYREQFSFGGGQNHASYFFVTDKCNSCKRCAKICPQNCIDVSSHTAKIQQKHCLHCGNCKEICPLQAIERRTL